MRRLRRRPLPSLGPARDFVMGMRVEIETDHKPLVPLLSKKRLDSLPPRVLRFRLRLDKYNFEIRHVPGKLLYVALELLFENRMRTPTKSKRKLSRSSHTSLRQRHYQQTSIVIPAQVRGDVLKRLHEGY